MGFLLGSREQVKMNAFGNGGRPNQSTAGNVLLSKIFCLHHPQKRNAVTKQQTIFLN